MVRVPETYEGAVEALRAILERQRELGRDLGLLVPGKTPRRKRGCAMWCENPKCPNGIEGPGAFPAEDEHLAWLDGKRRDAAFCSNRCRQAVYRIHDRRDRGEWWEVLQTVQANLVKAYPDEHWIPLNARTWKVWRDLLMGAVEPGRV